MMSNIRCWYGEKGCDNAWLRKGLLLAVLASNLLILNGRARAQENGAPAHPSSERDAAVSGAANQDLLLFWEEKELYVQTATRTAKPISQVAENMEVITAKDIEEMNAHTVSEVLNRVPGLLVDFGSNDFNSPAQLHIQGGASRHVTVFLDGAVWNFPGDGHAETLNIPVGIIDRIEIIKGPASSAWGSGLSGVVNIITKPVGDTELPKATVNASYGKARSRELNANVAGKAGKAGYFLHAGRSASDGLANDRRSQSDSLYAKLALSPAHNMELTLTVGYSDLDLGQGTQQISSPFGDIATTGNVSERAFHATSALEYRFSPDLALKAEVGTVRLKFRALTTFITPNGQLQVDRGDIFKDIDVKDRSTSGNLKLIYTGGIHAAVLGVEASRSEETQATRLPWRNLSSGVNPEVKNYAVFANDTFTLGSFAVTPGIRFDHDSISGNFVSPSLGTTYQFSEHSIARVSIARGFTRPAFIMTSGGGSFWEGNPGVTAEQGWSYQAGLESAVMDRVNLKGTLFRHDIDNAISDGPDPVAMKHINVGKIVRQGYELSAESAPLYNISLKLANSFVQIDPEGAAETTRNYAYRIGLKYDDRKSWLAQLSGTYIGWDLAEGVGNSDHFVWDGSVNRRFQFGNERSLELFFMVRNIFDAPYTTLLNQPNPGRWVEGGVKWRF